MTEKMTIPQRCRAQAESMDLEGWHVCANVLRAAAEEIERLEILAGIERWESRHD